MFIGGIIAGWLLTMFAQGIVESRLYFNIDGQLYKEITGNATPRCTHDLNDSCRINSVEFWACRFCDGVFVSVSDMNNTGRA